MRWNIKYASPFLFWPFTLYRGPFFKLYRIVALPVLAALPASLAYGFGLIFADAWMRLSSKEARFVSRNMDRVFGASLPAARRANAVREMYRVQSCTMIDEARLTWKDARLFGLIEVIGEERIRESLSKGRGVMLLGGHYGSYRVLSTFLGARGFPISQFSRAPSELNPRAGPIMRFIHRILVMPITRNIKRPFIRLQTDFISEGEFGGAVKASMILRANEAFQSQLDAVPSARDANRTVAVGFLDREVHVLAGAVTLAKATGSDILVMLIQRKRDWKHQILRISRPIDTSGSDQEVYQRCFWIFDAAVRDKPGHWQMWADDRPAKLGLMN